MKKLVKAICITLSALILFIALALFGLFIGDRIKFKSFYDVAEKHFKIPGVNGGYIPQGFDYYAENDVFLASGYMKGDAPSRVYVCDRKGKGYYTELLKKDGGDYKGHVGGVTYFGDYLYIAGSKGIDVFSLSDVLNKDQKTATLIATVDTLGVKPSFCTVVHGEESVLYVGSFHREKGYQTEEKFHVTTPCGDENKATMLAFSLSESAEYGLETTPVAAYSLPSLVQGVAFTEDRLVLSTSYGMASSHLYFHDLDKVKQNANTTYGQEVFGVDIPLYYAQTTSLVKTVKAPAMAEEIVYLDGKIWIMNESACNKYLFGKFTQANYLYAFAV